MLKNRDKNKKYKVSTTNWSSTVIVDETLYDDPFVEACTRVIERKVEYLKKRNKGNEFLDINPVLVCRRINKGRVNQKIINTYKVLQNASYNEKAEYLRDAFLTMSDVDLAREPLSSSISKI